MVISSDFRMGKPRDDDHEEDAPYFTKRILLRFEVFPSAAPIVSNSVPASSFEGLPFDEDLLF